MTWSNGPEAPELELHRLARRTMKPDPKSNKSPLAIITRGIIRRCVLVGIGSSCTRRSAHHHSLELFSGAMLSDTADTLCGRGLHCLSWFGQARRCERMDRSH